VVSPGNAYQTALVRHLVLVRVHAIASPEPRNQRSGHGCQVRVVPCRAPPNPQVVFRDISRGGTEDQGKLRHVQARNEYGHGTPKLLAGLRDTLGYVKLAREARRFPQ